MRAASRAGVRHLVYISVVGADPVPMMSGIDRAMFGYFGTKHAAERVVAESDLLWTTLRATQFHELILMIARQMAKLPVLPVPSGIRFQPIAAGEVADRLVELALGFAGRVSCPISRAHAATVWTNCCEAYMQARGACNGR